MPYRLVPSRLPQPGLMFFTSDPVASAINAQMTQTLGQTNELLRFMLVMLETRPVVISDDEFQALLRRGSYASYFDWVAVDPYAPPAPTILPSSLSTGIVGVVGDVSYDNHGAGPHLSQHADALPQTQFQQAGQQAVLNHLSRSVQDGQDRVGRQRPAGHIDTEPEDM